MNVVLNTRTRIVHLLDDAPATTEKGPIRSFQLACGVFAEETNLTMAGEPRDEGRPCERCAERLKQTRKRFGAMTRLARRRSA